MTTWTLFGSLQDILISFYFGSHVSFAISMLAVMLIAFLASGAGVKYTILFLIPLAAGLAIGGWFGVETWILHQILVVVGVIYYFAILKLMEAF